VADPSNADALFAQGNKYYSEKAYGRAVKAWKSALELYKQMGKKREVGILSCNIGIALRALGRYREALVSCTQAVRILREVNDPEELSRALESMGIVLSTLGYFAEAARAFDQAAEMHRRIGQLREQIELLLKAGEALERTGELEQSRSRYEEAVELAGQLKEIGLQINAQSAYARILQQLEDYDTAEKAFQELVQLYGRTGDRIMSANALLGLASTYIARGQLDSAEAIIPQAQEVLRDTDDAISKAVLRYHQARLLLGRGCPQEALQLAEQAFNVFKNQKELQAAARCSLLIGQILERLERGSQALRYYGQAMELFSEAKLPHNSIQARISRGRLLLQLGKDEQASQEFGAALRYYREHRQPKQEAKLYLEVASVMDECGRHEEAKEQCKLAIPILQKLQEEDLEVLAYTLLLRAAQRSGTIEEERGFLEEALELAKNHGKKCVASVLSVTLAQLALDTEKSEQAVAELEKALSAEYLPSEHRVLAALKLGSALMEQGKFAEAIQHLNQAIASFGEQPNTNKAMAYYHLSEAYSHLGKPDLQREALENALASLPPGENELLRARMLLHLAALSAPKDAERAINYYEQAIPLFEKWDEPEELFSALIGDILLLAATKRSQQALERVNQAFLLAEELDIPLETKGPAGQTFIHLRKAVEAALFSAGIQYGSREAKESIEKVLDWSTRRKVAGLLPFLVDDLGFEKCTSLPSLREEELRLTRQAASLRRQLAQLPRTDEKTFIQQRDQIRRQLLDTLNQLDVNRNVISAACTDPGRTLPPRNYQVLQKIRTLMPPNLRWVLLNYDVLWEQRLLILTTTDHVGRARVYTLQITDSLVAIINRLGALQSSQELPPPFQLKEIGTQLYRSLIPSQLAQDLRSHTYLYTLIISDGLLHHLPFELLFDGEQYWGIKYAISWAPDLIYLECTLKTHALAEAAKPSVVLGVNSGPEDKAARKQVAEEITKAFLSVVPTSRAVSEPTVLFGPNFTRELLSKAIAQPCTLLFLSTPTTLHHRKGEIALNPPDSLRAIELGVRVNFRGAPILVLDDCIRLEPQEDGMSLVGFLRRLSAAGTTSTIFTRWHPSPQLQPRFAATLASRLYEGTPIAVALQHTRRQLATADPSPHSWLAYTLCGNPFPTLLSSAS